MRTNRKGGFTLIELLIVIAIIGILAAVLIPNLMQARKAAGTRAAQSHLSNVYTALNAYLAEHVRVDPSALTELSCAPEYDAEGAGEYKVNEIAVSLVKDCTISQATDEEDAYVTVTLGNGTTQPDATLSIPPQDSDTFEN